MLDTPVPTPWIGLAAIVAMFVLPALPAWLFEGPRRVRHWPREHVCARCDAVWTDGHTCPVPDPPSEDPLEAELVRVLSPPALESPPGRRPRS
jgi:hypothetical protein